MNEEEKKIKQYDTLIGLYKFYFDMIMKATTYYYLITGGIVTYILSEDNSNTVVNTKLALILPITLSFCLGIIFFIGGYLNRETRNEVEDIGRLLGYNAPPEMNILSIILFTFGALILTTGLFLIYVMIKFI